MNIPVAGIRRGVETLPTSKSIDTSLQKNVFILMMQSSYSISAFDTVDVGSASTYVLSLTVSRTTVTMKKDGQIFSFAEQA